MYTYKAIIWLSLIAIIGEGIVLSGFDFSPYKNLHGEVLGERTNQALDNLALTKFPASYYAGVAQSVVVESASSAPQSAEEQNSPIAPDNAPDSSQTSPHSSRDALVQLLNTPSQYEIAFPREQTKNIAPNDGSVDAIIKKNERLYREQIIK